MIPSNLLIPVIVSNLFALVLLLAGWFWPKTARGFFVLIFFAASIVNIVTALRNPGLYVEGYGDLALLPVYRDFIHGFFSRHTAPIVLTIAAGQLMVAILLIQKKLLFFSGTTGAVLFLLAIAPLGLGSAFPSTLVLAGAIIMVYHKIKMAEEIEETGIDF